MKRLRGLSARGERAAKKEKRTRGKRIDFFDIPELSDRQLSTMHRIGRLPLGDEARKLIAIRMDSKVLAWVRKAAMKKGMPYQSLINDILAKEMKQAG